MSFIVLDLKKNGKKRMIGSGNLVASRCLSLNWCNMSSVFRKGSPYKSLVYQQSSDDATKEIIFCIVYNHMFVIIHVNSSYSVLH